MSDHVHDAEHVFTCLKALVGAWESIGSGPIHTVSHRLTANGTALLETWRLGSGREALTIYAMEDGRLNAIHICPHGNQPFLQYRRGGAEGFVFELTGGMNLDAPGSEHQQSFRIAIASLDAFSRSERYVPNGSTASDIATIAFSEAFPYRRVRP